MNEKDHPQIPPLTLFAGELARVFGNYSGEDLPVAGAKLLRAAKDGEPAREIVLEPAGSGPVLREGDTLVVPEPPVRKGGITLRIPEILYQLHRTDDYFSTGAPVSFVLETWLQDNISRKAFWKSEDLPPEAWRPDFSNVKVNDQTIDLEARAAAWLKDRTEPEPVALKADDVITLTGRDNPADGGSGARIDQALERYLQRLR